MRLLTNNTDRFEMLQEQHSLTLRDLDELTKRYYHLNERLTTMDIEYSRVTERLNDTAGQIDQLLVNSSMPMGA